MKLLIRRSDKNSWEEIGQVAEVSFKNEGNKIKVDISEYDGDEIRMYVDPVEEAYSSRNCRRITIAPKEITIGQL